MMRLIFRDGFVVQWVEDSKLFVEKGAHGITGNLYLGFNEKEMILLLKAINRNDVFFDIGANRGSYTVLASKVGKCKTISFEPAKSTFMALKKTIDTNGINKNVKALNLALSTNKGKVNFSLNKDTTNFIVDDYYKGISTEVEVQTVDNISKDHSFPSIVKIDVEGNELSVLKGAKKTLKSNNVKIWIIEDSTFYTSKETKNFMEEFNYCPFKYSLLKNKIEPINQMDDKEANIIYAQVIQVKSINKILERKVKFYNHITSKKY